MERSDEVVMHFPLHFLSGQEDLGSAMGGSYDPLLVLLSVLVASVAGYSALLTSERMLRAASPLARKIWLCAGGVAMGSGIWTMHFVGMLAFHMEMPVGYDPVLTAISAVPGILASGVALHFMARPRIRFGLLNLGGLLMGGGIGAMHYTGMAAMVMDAELRYDPLLFGLSIVVAHTLATLSLYVKFVMGRRLGTSWPLQPLSALIMGGAVAGMHYTAMAASYYFPTASGTAPDVLLGPTTLAIVVSLAATLLLATAIISATVDRRLQEISVELRESEEQTRLIVETAGEGIVTIDESGTVTRFNRAAANTFGYRSDEVIGRNVSMLAPEGLAAVHDGYIRRYLETGEARIVGSTREVRARRRDGSTFPLLLSVSECQVAGRRAFTGILRDLSEQRRLEAQLLQSQKLESIGQLAAGIAHEINTPSQYVGDNVEFLEESFEGLLEVLKEHEALLGEAEAAGALPESAARVREKAEAADVEFLREEIPRALEQSREGIERVTRIVGAMKQFSHPASKEKKPLDINSAISSTLTVASNEWKYVADLETDFEEGLEPAFCLAAEFNQVILNIVMNAAQAIGETAEDGEKGRITLRTRSEGDFVRIEIHDSGPGIPEDMQQRIFDPFFTTKDVGEGTGQGLAIARSVIVDKHDGTLEVESELGKGSTFTIRLPFGEGTDAVEDD